MKPILLLVLIFVLPGSFVDAWAPASDDTPQGLAEARLARSATALQAFRDAASDVTLNLFDSALCIGVAPRRDSGENTTDAKGFVSCRSGLTGAWSNPAAFSIAGGGTFWPVLGDTIDVILFTANPATASHFADSEGMLGSPNLLTDPGPVRTDQTSTRSGAAAILVYGQSNGEITGMNLAGAAISEDRITNSLLYNSDLGNAAIVTRRSGGERKPMTAAAFLAALPASATNHSGKAFAESQNGK